MVCDMDSHATLPVRAIGDGICRELGIFDNRARAGRSSSARPMGEHCRGIRNVGPRPAGER
jgi:hypothetical protein